jgi:release factor glutamine methyltransferase
VPQSNTAAPTDAPTAPTAASWRDLYDETRHRVDNEMEARWIVEEASGCSWSELAGEGNPATPVTTAAVNRLRAMLDRRATGEPLQYVLGHWSFRTIDLMVDRRVLIPRPETEQVVEAALRELDAARDDDPGRRLVAVDLGTGSGAIALSIAAERPRVNVWATDISQAALDVASANLAGMGGFRATRVRFAQGSWWAALPDDLRGKVDLVVSNPPYVSAGEMASLDPVVRDWEPASALEAGPTGLEALEEILADATEWLTPNGAAVIEIATHQADAAAATAREYDFRDVRVEPDLAGRDRVLVARLAGG